MFKLSVNQLIVIDNDLNKTIDDGKELRVVFCDMECAFDRV